MASNSQEPAGARAEGIHSAGLFAAGATVLLLIGCAAPGVPVTRQAAAARAITDLSAKQSGDSIVLTFTLPKETIQGKALSKPPAIEIYRAFRSAQAVNGGSPPEPQLVTTVPVQMVDQYREGDRIHFSDVLAPADLATHVGGAALYAVRTRLAKHDSGDSNVVQVQILPAPQPIEDLRAQITQTTVELSWTMPAILPAGSAPPVSFRYRVYRAEAPPAGNHPASLANSRTHSDSAQVALLGESATSSYGDTSFTFGHTYAYTIRSVATYESGSVESEESNVLNVTPRDTFAPATPENIAATATPSNGSVAAHVDLSWAINSESDLLGYNVYRSDTEGGPGIRVNATPLVTPAFRDNLVVAGEQYFYRVTAVDRAGNESAPSAPIAVTVPTADNSKNP